jgi:hypothetical protein
VTRNVWATSSGLEPSCTLRTARIPKCFQRCVIQLPGTVFAHAERESWMIRRVKKNMTLLMDRLIECCSCAMAAVEWLWTPGSTAVAHHSSLLERCETNLSVDWSRGYGGVTPTGSITPRHAFLRSRFGKGQAARLATTSLSGCQPDEGVETIALTVSLGPGSPRHQDHRYPDN